VDPAYPLAGQVTPDGGDELCGCIGQQLAAGLVMPL
jgi:hypothetical protein